jgi:predicted nucleic acid-binding protein
MLEKLSLFRREIVAKIVIDAYAWIELFIGSGRGLEVKKLIENADEIYTPGTVLAEIARKYVREGIDEKTIDARLEVIASASNITHIDAGIALETSRCYSELTTYAKKSKLNTPSLFDAIVLATGRLSKSKIVTGDEHFKNLAETIWIGKSR